MINQDELKSMVYYERGDGSFVLRHMSTFSYGGDITYKKGAMYLSIGGRVYSVRKLIWLYVTGKWHQGRIYTVSGDPQETRWAYLTDNQSEAYRKPAKLSSRNTSGHTGITYNAERERWVVRLNVNGKRKYIGVYKDRYEAIAAKKRAMGLKVPAPMFL